MHDAQPCSAASADLGDHLPLTTAIDRRPRDDRDGGVDLGNADDTTSTTARLRGVVYRAGGRGRLMLAVDEATGVVMGWRLVPDEGFEGADDG